MYTAYGDLDVMLEQQNEDGSVELLERCPPRMNNL
ncbi:Stage V sporulation protein involved in spore cortex synthesis (SpoVR) [Salmonella bongori]|nr:Stage V sporulation protein involved in spore cortex synthesis (SpoVR) [Salmonella bongori]